MDWAYYCTSFQFLSILYAHILGVHAKFKENIPLCSISVHNEYIVVVVVVALLFYVHGKHLRSCWDGQLT